MPIVSIGLDGNLKREEAIVGIDLGTTNSLVAWVEPDSGKPITLKGRSGNAIVPSLIHFGPEGQVIVGREAIPFLIESPENTIYSVKRLMGRSYQDISSHQSSISYKIIDDDRDSLVKIRSGNRFYTPIELSSFILKELKLRAEQELGRTVSKAVITVPAYFNDVQRQATRDAGKLAGLEVLRIVNEPTAASLAYGLEQENGDEKVVAVYDMGGGTFDISILRISNGIYEVLATKGDTYLGGDDFDRAIAEWWMEQYNIKPEEFRAEASIRQALRLLAEALKKDLTTKEESRRPFLFEGKEYSLTLNRRKLNELILPYLHKTLDCCRDAMKDSGLTLRDIKEVVLVGGSTRTLAVKDAVQGFFLHSRLHTDLNPDEVVALGAALEADILAGRRTDMLLLDVTPLSLGIETLGGLMDVLIPRNTKIPARIGKQYTTSVDGQVSLKINVYQGERELVEHNRKLAEFILKGIPAMPAGLPKIEVDFILNADGILQVDAQELRSGIQQSIEVKPQYGLTDEQVEQLLLDSITHAGEDVAERMLREAKTEAQQMLYVTERFLGKNASLLSDEELQHSNLLLNDLRNALESNDKDTILGHIDELNEYTRPFAERLMDQSISSALKGKNIEG